MDLDEKLCRILDLIKFVAARSGMSNDDYEYLKLEIWDFIDKFDI